jgi:cupin fold WbuC family metalloprotein
MNHNHHPTLADPIQRLLNAYEPGTYFRPHRHPQAERWELFLCLRGRAVVLTFEDPGRVRERVVLDPSGPALAVEIPPGVCHAIASLAPGTVLFELAGFIVGYAFLTGASMSLVGAALAMAAGLMTYISLDELLPAAELRQRPKAGAIAIILGVATVLLLSRISF